MLQNETLAYNFIHFNGVDMMVTDLMYGWTLSGIYQPVNFVEKG